MSEKIRLDLLLLEKSLASSRTKAQELIENSFVKVNGAIVSKPGEKIDSSAQIELLQKEYPYVSRGGLKLEAALRGFPFDVKNKVVLDIGISTGGFAHCLLLHGAKKVIGVDVGHDQLAKELRSEERLLLLEQQDIRTLARLPEQVERFTADLSFISLKLVLPELPRFLKEHAEGIVLVKPQFELSADKLGSGGIVRSAALREEALHSVQNCAEKCGYRVCGVMPSPISGGDGNQEFLLHLGWNSSGQGF
jgi:23S rRNA (cytidine1920-2'-O)/16S rRNA (cytidine1409-2'-O)-methyltransferase